MLKRKIKLCFELPPKKIFKKRGLSQKDFIFQPLVLGNPGVTR